MKLYSYNPGSASAKVLSAALGIKRIKHEGKPLRVAGIINWGASQFKREIQPFIGHLFNPPGCVTKAVNKLSTFKYLEGHVPIPEWTEEREEAVEWLAEGPVVARTVLNGFGGKGLVIVEKLDDFIDAPLYTKYIHKKQEYRLHVFRDRVFFVQRKARNKEIPDDKVNWKVRNHGNGFIFANKDVDVCEEAKRHAIMAVDKLGLDFGAVDLIWNAKEDKYYVIEVNTACGLEGTTLDKYVEVFKEFV